MALETTKMVRNTACTSCGAAVPIYSRASVQVVCPFCRSTLVRTDLQWENIGTMAALADDLSPLFIGLRGQVSQTSFTIIGRLQQQYAEGIWNEWLLQLDNRKVAWLGEGSGLFYLTIPSTTSEILPTFSSISLGQTLTLDGKYYRVSNIENARCIATQGEIPFSAEPGHFANFVDLTGENGLFASLDYSDEQPKLYTGKTLNLDELQLEAITSGELKQQASKELRCAGCGNAVTLHNPASLVVACASCRMVNNISAGSKLIVAFAQANQSLQPKITLGSHGILKGHSYEAIGFMRRSADGDSWDEYLLYNPAQGVRWLICADGHWTFMQPAKSHTYSPSVIFHKNMTFKHFADYDAAVTDVLGEFYWQVKKGERNRCSDYICAPFILCCEKSAKEIVWSEGYYIDGNEIASAFNIEKISTSGVGINQPTPPILGYIAAYSAAMLLAVFISVILNSTHGQRFNIGHLDLTPDVKTTKLVSEPFTVKSAHGLFQVQTDTTVNNNWANFEYSLINQATGETRVMNREIAYYSGYDSDGNWSEGSNSDEATLANVTAGTYVLEVDAETNNSSMAAPNTTVSVNINASHAEGNSKNFWLLFFALGIGPLIAGLNKYYFEKRRWDQSDHPWEHFEQ